jgi:hypothetical protein
MKKLVVREEINEEPICVMCKPPPLPTVTMFVPLYCCRYKWLRLVMIWLVAPLSKYHECYIS